MTIHERAIEKWGIKAQLEMMLEESIELSLAVRKYLRAVEYGGDISKREQDLIGEIADVKNMIDQMYYIFDKDQIDKVSMSKLDRLEKRLDKISST